MLTYAFLLCFCPLAFTQRLQDFPRLYIKITQLNCNFNPEWVVNASCKLKPTNWETSAVNASFLIIKPLRNLTLYAQIYRRETRYVPFLVKVTMNACDLFDNKGLNFYSTMALNLFKKFCAIEHPTCPLLGQLRVKNVALDTKYFPIPLPIGVYKLVVRMTEEYPPQFVGLVEVICNIAEKSRRKNKIP